MAPKLKNFKSKKSIQSVNLKGADGNKTFYYYPYYANLLRYSMKCKIYLSIEGNIYSQQLTKKQMHCKEDFSKNICERILCEDKR